MYKKKQNIAIELDFSSDSSEKPCQIPASKLEDLFIEHCTDDDVIYEGQNIFGMDLTRNIDSETEDESISIRTNTDELLENESLFFSESDLEYETLILLDDNIKKKGMTKTSIKKLGSFMYFPNRIQRKKTINKECIICLSDFIQKEKITVLKCTHSFHTKCLQEWLVQRSTCPTCRIELNSFK